MPRRARLVIPGIPDTSHIHLLQTPENEESAELLMKNLGSPMAIPAMNVSWMRSR